MEGRLPLLPLILHQVPNSFQQALGQEGIPYRMYRAGAAEGRFLIVDSRFDPPESLAPGQMVFDLAELRREFPQDPFKALEDTGSERLQWRMGPWELRQEVARVDKRMVRQQLLDRLRRWIDQHGGLWLRVAPVPFPYRSVFSFRIDHTQYCPEDFQRTLEAVVGWEQAISHFITPGPFQAAPEALERLQGLDVGLHGDQYETYLAEEENLQNISRAKQLLTNLGLNPIGYARPPGRWNRGLLAPLEKLGFAYLSEVGLAYDELPFRPFGTQLLYIPMHPISFRHFLEAAELLSQNRPPHRETLLQAAVDSALEYFCHLLETRTLAGEPLLLYGEVPGCLGRYPQLLRAVLASAGQYGSLWQTSLTEIYRWWEVRSRVHLTVYATPEGYELLVHQKPPGFRVAVELCRGTHVAIVPLEGPRMKLAPHALAFEKRLPAPRIGPVRIDPPESFRQRLRRWWQRYRQMPHEEKLSSSFPD